MTEELESEIMGLLSLIDGYMGEFSKAKLLDSDKVIDALLDTRSRLIGLNHAEPTGI